MQLTWMDAKVGGWVVTPRIGKPVEINGLWYNAQGNHYFPPDSVNREYLRESDYHTTCPWKGLASYYDVVVDDKVNKNAAWYYPAPKEAAKHVTGYVAFWRGVAVQ